MFIHVISQTVKSGGNDECMLLLPSQGMDSCSNFESLPSTYYRLGFNCFCICNGLLPSLHDIALFHELYLLISKCQRYSEIGLSFLMGN